MISSREWGLGIAQGFPKLWGSVNLFAAQGVAGLQSPMGTRERSPTVARGQTLRGTDNSTLEHDALVEPRVTHCHKISAVLLSVHGISGRNVTATRNIHTWDTSQVYQFASVTALLEDCRNCLLSSGRRTMLRIIRYASCVVRHAFW